MSASNWLKFAFVVLGAAIHSGCTTGNGDGLDINGRPSTGDNGGPLVATFKSIQDNVLTPFCTSCHAGPAAPVGLRLDEANSYALMVGIASVQVPGLLLVDPGDPDNSYLIQKIEGTAGVGARMPLGAPGLEQSTINVIRQWITDGAQPPATDDGTPPTVVSVLPEPNSLAAELPAEIRVIFSRPMDASLINATTFEVIRAGGDGGFDDGNEVMLVADSIGLAPANQALAMFDLTSTANVEDQYRITLVGTGATAMADLNGVNLDGDGDGQPGGDFVSFFGVSAVEPTLESIQANVFTPTCATAGCHTGPAGPGLPGGLDLSNAAASFASLVDVASVEVPALLRVEPDNSADSYLIQKIKGMAAVGAQMPLGGQQLPWPTIDVIMEWVDDGAPYEGGPPDITAPIVSVIVPASPLSGTVVLSANAVDDVAVASVAFFVDGASIGTSLTAPFALAWDTTAVIDGAHVLTARATDTSGNNGDSTPVNVTVMNAPPDVTDPTVTLTAPAAMTVSGLVTVAANATDDTGVTAVRFYIDGLLLGTDATQPYALDWDTTGFADGEHEIGAEASDAAGNVGVAISLTVTVDNGPSEDVTAPNVTLTAPAAGVVSGTVMLTADASDDVGVTEVRFFAGIEFIGADAVAPYQFDWVTTDDGPVTLTVEASDLAGNVGFSDPVDVIVNNMAPTVTSVDPADGATVGALPAAISVTFSEAINAATVNETSILLQASGGDGTFGDGNEADITPASVILSDPTTATMDLTGVASVEDTYRLTVVATVTDAYGLALDGDGNGTGGDDFSADFTVATPPTYTADVQPIFMAKCAPCHTGLGIGGHDIGTDYADASGASVACPGLNIAECSLVRIQNGSMPQGRGCTGDPATDAGNSNCLTQVEQDTVQAWINAGLPE